MSHNPSPSLGAAGAGAARAGPAANSGAHSQPSALACNQPLRPGLPPLLLAALLALRPLQAPVQTQALMSCHRRGERHFDALVFGDEPAGVMTALELARTLRQLARRPRPRIALVTDADIRPGLGGTIARGGLAYLDRNQVPQDMAGLLPPFAPSSELYGRFLKLTGVRQIAVDPRRASRAFTSALHRASITVLPRAALVGTAREGQRLCVLQSRRYGSVGADVFIDASIGADLAHQAGVGFRSGLGSRGLSRESIALGWIFEVQGLNLARLHALEEQLTRRLLNPRDNEAQGWIALWRAGHRDQGALRPRLLEPNGTPRLAFSSTSDSADQRSPALAIAFHGEQHLPPGLNAGQPVMDPANVAILSDRLSFNALLFRNNAEQNRRVLAGGSRPLPAMRPVAQAVTQFFRRHGARRVLWMPELYVRSADQIAHAWDPLSADVMAAGGVPTSEALGTFTYNLDFRGGLDELIPRARPTFNFGYRHTLPRELDNLAVLGPSSGYGGLGEGAGRIIELNVSVGQGLAIAAALALNHHIALAAVNPQAVAALMPANGLPYGRPSESTLANLLLRRLAYAVVSVLPAPLGDWVWDRL